MTFFFDRNLSEHLARIVASFDRENQVVHQDRDSRFGPTTSDVDLIRTVSGESPKPVFVTADVAQRRRPEERRALALSAMCIVFFRSGFHDLTFQHQAIKIITVWPNVVRSCGTCKHPSAFEITPKVSSDKVELICATRDLDR